MINSVKPARGFTLPLVIFGIIALVGVTAWAPWITKDYAFNKVSSSRLKANCKLYTPPPVVYDFKTTYPADVQTINFKDYLDFGRKTSFSYYCPPDTTIIFEDYFVSFLGSAHKTASRRGSYKLETANWKTYKSLPLGIEFQYPPNWKVEKLNEVSGIIEGPDFSREFQEAPVSETSPYSGTYILYGLSLENHNPDVPLLTYFKNLTQKVASMSTAPNDKIYITNIGGREAIRWDTHNQGFAQPAKDFVFTSYYVLHKGKFFVITKAYTLGSKGQYEETFNQILSTFKFTN